MFRKKIELGEAMREKVDEGWGDMEVRIKKALKKTEEE